MTLVWLKLARMERSPLPRVIALAVAVARGRELGEIALDAGRELVALVVRRLEQRELRFPP